VTVDGRLPGGSSNDGGNAARIGGFDGFQHFWSAQKGGRPPNITAKSSSHHDA